MKENKTLNEIMHTKLLNNGMNCYIIPKSNFVEKQAFIAVNYGSNDTAFTMGQEKVECPLGIAHYLEHKMFEEEWGNIFDEFTKLGSTANAFTNFDTTAYYFSCVERFEENLKLLLEFVQRPYFTEENVNKERQIIQQEIKMYDDDPSFKVFFNMLGAAYEKNTVRNNIAGSLESIDKIDCDILYKCYEAFYRPQNMTFVCAGNVNPDEVFNTLESMIAEKQDISINKIKSDEPECIVNSYVSANMPVSQPIFTIGFKDNNLYDLNKSDTSITNKILLSMLFGEGSDFYTGLFEKGDIGEGFGYDFLSGDDYGCSVLSGECKNIDIIVDAVKNQIKTINQKGFSDVYFERIKKKHIGRFVRGFNSINAVCMGQIELINRQFDIFDMFESLVNLSLYKVSERFKQHFYSDYSNMVVSVVNGQ